VAWLREKVASELKVTDLKQLKMVWEGRVLTDTEVVPVSTEGDFAQFPPGSVAYSIESCMMGM